MKKKNLSSFILYLWIVVIVFANIQYRVIGGRMMQTITWDKFGYYLYLPAFFYDDLSKVGNLQSLLDTYHPGNSYPAMPAPNGNYIMKYSCGMALMYFPAFVVGHAAAKIFNYPVDGMSLPYQAALNFESLLVAIIGLWLLRKILKKYFSDGVVAAVLFIIGFSSNYFQYAAYDNLFQHVYLFTLYCVIILQSIQWNRQPKYSTSLMLGLCCGLAALARPTEIVTALIPVLWGVYDRNTLIQKFRLLLKNYGMVITFGLAAILVGSLQLIYWKIYTGHWFYFSYGENQTFNWRHPHVADVLFSYRKGWFIYTPVMILSLIGFVTLYLRHRKFFWFATLFMVVYFYPVAAWDNWWYGGSFSMRAMIQSYPVLSFSIASLIEFIFSVTVLSFITTIFIAFCIWLNVVFTWQAYFSTEGIFDGDSMTNKYYWRVFGKFKIDKNDRRFMDTNEELPKSLRKNLSLIYFNDLENTSLPTDTIKSFSGRHSFMMNDSIQWTPVIVIPVDQKDQGWYRATAKIFCPEMEWDTWKQSQICISLSNDDTLIKEKRYRIYRIIDIGSWQDVSIDINSAINQPYDSLKVYFWNSGGKNPIYIDDIKIQKALTN